VGCAAVRRAAVRAWRRTACRRADRRRRAAVCRGRGRRCGLAL